MEKKTPPSLNEDSPAQDWTDLLPGQHVRVWLDDGANFTAIVESKTRTSSAVWILRDDNLNTRQVFGHTEAVHLVPIEQTADLPDQMRESPGRNAGSWI